MILFSAAVPLVSEMDPLGDVPLFRAALRHVDPARVRTIILARRCRHPVLAGDLRRALGERGLTPSSG